MVTLPFVGRVVASRILKDLCKFYFRIYSKSFNGFLVMILMSKGLIWNFKDLHEKVYVK